MTSADMRGSAKPGRGLGSGSIVPLAVVACCAVIGLDQVLHTTPAAFSASPLTETLRWAGNVVLAVPFAAVAIWAGGWLGSRLGINLTGKWGVFTQACLITLVLAVLLVPAWFGHYAVDSVAPAPVVPSAGGHAGHDHGGASPPITTSWVNSGVLYLLMSIPIAAAAVCVGQRVTSRLAARLGSETDVIVRATVGAGGVALGLGLGWFLEGVASQTSGLLTYASRFSVVHLHHHAHAHLATVTAVVVQPAFGYQLATAAQDALAGQAVALPVIFAGLMWLTRRMCDGRTTSTAPIEVTN
ncbi:MAG TPA: hypothetical protein VGI74_20330 [Streptosporangiaceae bacterium]|jgi:hypothetical protein